MLKKIADHLFSQKSVAIFVHENPDWDCIGSAFALRNALRNKNIKSDVFTENALSHHLSFMETDVIIYTDGSTPDYECYCALDVSDTKRMGAWGDIFASKENTVCIDHHIAKDSFAALSHIEHTRSATGELIFELLQHTDVKLTKEIASYIYCAISADTGSFQYASVNKRTYEIVIALTEAGIDSAHLSSMLYERNTLTQLKLKAETINSIRLYGDGKIAIASVSSETLEKYNALPSDVEALAQIPRSIDGVVISAFIKEVEKGNIRVSLRALGDYNIEPVARVFGGGGHKKAAGCRFADISIEKAEKALVDEFLKLV